MCALPAAGRKPGRPKDPNLEARRRVEILDAAGLAFAEFGFAGTDVQVVADRLGVGKGTVYRYFPTKQELFLAAVDRGLQDLTDTVDAVLADEAADPLGQMADAVRAYLTFFHRRPHLVELFIQERAEFRDRHTPLYFATRDGAERRCREEIPFVRKLVAAGRMRPIDPERFVAVVGDLLYGTVVSNRLSGRPSSPAAQAKAILDVVLYGVLSDAERKRPHRAGRAGEGKK